MNRLPFWTLAWCLLSGCAQYGLELRGSDPSPREPRIVVPGDLYSVSQSLENYLHSHGRLESKSGHVAEAKLRLTQTWNRGLSLRYYYRNYGDRSRHLGEWKSQWIARSLGPQQTEVSVKVLEVIYFGPVDQAGPRPDVEAVKNLPFRDWFETPPDNLRALFELRRYWTETYPRASLPAQLADLKVPSLDGPPASKEWPKPWEPLKRRASF